MIVSTLATPLIDRLSASRICCASVVKRAVWRAGDSLTATARSASVTAAKSRRCSPSMVRSTVPCTASAWPYIANARAVVTATITGGRNHTTPGSLRLNRSKACWITIG